MELTGGKALTSLEIGIFDPVVNTASLEGVMHLAGAVGSDNDHRRLGRDEGADLRDGDLKVGQDFQEKALKLLKKIPVEQANEQFVLACE